MQTKLSILDIILLRDNKIPLGAFNKSLEDVVLYKK